MIIEIDQSGKIENTSKDTVVAFSDDDNKSILLKARDKRKMQKFFREQNQGSIFIYKTFANLIYALIKDNLNKIQQIVIDPEYPGHEAEIKHYLLEIIRKKNKDFPKDNITFKQIGKKSNAHILAHKVYQKKHRPNIFVKVDNFIGHILKLK